MEYLILILVFAGIFIIGVCIINKQQKLMKEGRSIIATIEYIRPISSDESGNTTVTYILSFEGRTLKGTEKIDTFYAPQLQPGKTIKLMYKDDKNYMFLFDQHAQSNEQKNYQDL